MHDVHKAISHLKTDPVMAELITKYGVLDYPKSQDYFARMCRKANVEETRDNYLHHVNLHHTASQEFVTILMRAFARIILHN